MASNSAQPKGQSPTSPKDKYLESTSSAAIKAGTEKQHQNTSTDMKNSRPDKINVEKNVIYNQETLKYMRIIDEYKKLGIGKDIELPRLVIAGTQSCGKSSLLENLTGLPVPITTGIGTRFPIEITLIEDPNKFQIKPSIVLDPKAQTLSPMELEKMQKFNLGQVYNEPINQVEFEDLLREASDLLGVPPPVFARDQLSNIKSMDERSLEISSHVLQIEMRGPNFESLSFVDTPGLYLSGNVNQNTTSAGKVEKLVVSLIEEKRTVVVYYMELPVLGQNADSHVSAVMEATQGTVSQGIFKFAEDVDINGERTIGVMTKCDLVPTPEVDRDAFETTLRRAKNQEKVLKHGWYVVKNRSSSEAKEKLSLENARQKESTLFSGPGWHTSSSGLLAERMGIAALRTGLSNVFCAHIRAEFPIFNQQTRTILQNKQQQIGGLGPARSTVNDQRQYLRLIVAAYQAHRNHLLEDDFRPSKLGDVRPISVDLGFHKKIMFRDRLRNTGTVWKFQTPTPERDEASDSASTALFSKATTSNIYTWINYRYQNTKSCALPGIVPYALIERLFEEQTSNWTSLTDDFVSGVEKVFELSIKHCLKLACPNVQVLASLNDLVAAELHKKMKEFKDLCHRHILNEQQGLQVVASEEQFINDLREARTLRFLSAIAKLENDTFFLTGIPPFSLYKEKSPDHGTTKSTGGTLFGLPHSGRSTPEPPRSIPTSGAFSFGAPSPATTTAQSKPTSSSLPGEAPITGTMLGSTTSSILSNVPAAKAEGPTLNFKSLHNFAKDNKDRLKDVLTNERQIVYEIHDILKAYYATSVQHYTDSVCKNGLNQTAVEETLNLFSVEFVDNLPDEEISRIAAESPADRKTRRELKEDIERLETAISVSEAILKEPMMV